MKKEEYRREREDINNRMSDLREELVKTEKEYIEHNKPCNIGDNVEIVLGSDRKVNGEVLSFDILQNSTVCITSYKENSKTKYITTPHKSVTILNKK